MTVVPYTREPVSERPWLALQSPALELANAIAGTDFVPAGLRNNPAAITAAILYGDEVGLGPMQSLAKIAVIKGRPTLAAEAQRALILAAGHDLWVEESTTTKCTMCGRRRDSDATSRITWTMDDARRANLAGQQNYRAYPRQMLLARASAELARAVFPDAIGGLAATEELEDGPGALENGSQPSEPVAPTRRRRRTSVTSSPAATTPEVSAATTGERPPVPGDEPPQEEVISEAQRRRLRAIQRQVGVPDAEVKRIVADLGGVDSSKLLPRTKYDAVIDAIAGWNKPEGEPFTGASASTAQTPSPSDGEAKFQVPAGVQTPLEANE